MRLLPGLAILLSLHGAGALAQGTGTLPPDPLTPTIKPLPGPPPVSLPQAMPPPARANPTGSCACTETVQVPVYENGRIVAYERVTRNSGRSSTTCCSR